MDVGWVVGGFDSNSLLAGGFVVAKEPAGEFASKIVVGAGEVEKPGFFGIQILRLNGRVRQIFGF